ncbi:Protoheme IX farnesyltransferase [Dirofilaria immitis]
MFLESLAKNPAPVLYLTLQYFHSIILTSHYHLLNSVVGISFSYRYRQSVDYFELGVFEEVIHHNVLRCICPCTVSSQRFHHNSSEKIAVKETFPFSFSHLFHVFFSVLRLSFVQQYDRPCNTTCNKHILNIR